MPSAGDRILLVENDPEISDLIARQTLKSMGYQVTVASDSSSAIKSAVQTPPDLIIADFKPSRADSQRPALRADIAGCRYAIACDCKQGAGT